jgi:hypothetical protein
VTKFFELLDLMIVSNDARVIKIVCSLYTHLLELNPKKIDHFLKKIEEPGGLGDSLFLHSSLLINKIYLDSGISESIQ